MNIKIDVIIPTYNRAHFIERSITSVLNQSYKNFELYLIDDGSTDNTKEVVAPFLALDNFHYLKKENQGVSAARNFGIKNSNSPWVSFLDSDDEWLSHKLQEQACAIQNSPELSFFHSNEIWMRNGVRVNLPKKFDKGHHGLIERSLEMCLISPSTVIIKRDLLLEFNGFDESILLCEDFDLWNKILANYKVGFIEKELIIKYAGHDDQLSMIDPLMDMWRIRSLSKLLAMPYITDEKQKLIYAMIAKKIPVLERGLTKFNKQSELQELENLKSILGKFLA